VKPSTILGRYEYPRVDEALLQKRPGCRVYIQVSRRIREGERIHKWRQLGRGKLIRHRQLSPRLICSDVEDGSSCQVA
jgi:hypothetical protein